MKLQFAQPSSAVPTNAGRGPSAAGLRRLGRIALLTGALAGTGTTRAAESPPAGAPLVRFGFSRTMFNDVNENDARASLRVYVNLLVARTDAIAAQPDAQIFEDQRALNAALRNGEVDIVSASVREILAIPDQLVSAPYMLARFGKTTGTEYALLVRGDGGITSLAELKGRRILILTGARSSLALTWLEVLLGKQHLASPEKLLAEIKLVAKPSQAALPVFFGQMDACIISRESLALLAEMNPQVAVQLRPLAMSPPVVPVLTAFRRTFDATQREMIAMEATRIHTHAIGRQMLTIFQGDRVEMLADAELETTRQLLADHARLRTAGQESPASPPLSTPSPNVR